MKNFFDTLYEYDCEPVLIVPAIINGIGSLIVLLAYGACAADPNVVFDHNPDDDWIILTFTLIMVSIPLLFTVFKLLDLLIDHTIRDITSGARGKRDFFMGLFYPDYILRDQQFNFFIMAILLGFILSWVFLFFIGVFHYPAGSIVFVLVGGYFAIVKLAKFVYNVSTRLTRHEADPNAHNRGK